MKTNGILLMIFVSLFTGIIITGCEPENPLEYQDDPAVYFNGALADKPNATRMQDSTSMSFAEESGSDYIFWVEVLTQGMVSEEDRPIVVKQVTSANSLPPEYENAIPGVHYVPLTDPAIQDYFKIPAGKVRNRIPVTLLRNDDLLLGKKFIIDLELEPTGDFRLGMSNKLHFRIKFSGMPEKPRNWNTWDSYCKFGVWGPVKHSFILSVCPIVWTELPDIALAFYYQSTVKNALVKYNSEHPDNPLRELDGTLVSFRD
jgi:hypothetical protein